MQRQAEVAQGFLLRYAKIIYGVAGEGSRVKRLVWRVEIDEIVLPRCQRPKITPLDVDALQSAVAGPQSRFVANRRILVAAHRHIELSLGIDAPEAVEAGLVEIDEASGALYAVVEQMPRSQAVVIIAVVVLGVIFEQLD